MEHQKPNIFAASSGLDEIDDSGQHVSMETAEGRDFADDIRRRIADEFTAKQRIGGFEVGQRHSQLFCYYSTSCCCCCCCCVRGVVAVCVLKR